MASFDYEAECLAETLDETKASLIGLHEKLRVLNSAICSLCEDLPEYDAPAGAYTYIPIDIGEFLQSLFDLEHILKNDPDYRHSDLPYRPCAFVEAGCGTGRNVFLLKHAGRFHFNKIVGFDISEPYIEYGRDRFRLGNDLFVDDCLTFDYGGFDVVYFYRPFSDDNQETAFENRVIETMKRGAFLIGETVASLGDSRDLMPMGESERIWKRL